MAEQLDGVSALPVGDALQDWTPRPAPPPTPMIGRFCRLEPLAPERHGVGLWRAIAGPESAARWTYMGYGPFADQAAFSAWLEGGRDKADPQFFTICAPDSAPLGLAAFLRIDPASGVIEIGHLMFGPALSRRPAATEAIALMLRRVFDELGYRRCEWKCDALNTASRRAAARFGFVYEGTFRQALVYKGRNRDTAWHALLDGDWPQRRAAFDAWLAPENFTTDGMQLRPL